MGSQARGDLCAKCAGMTIDDLTSKSGYLHWPSYWDLLNSARHCGLCQLMTEVLDPDKTLAQRASLQIIVRLSNGNHHGCDQPNVLRSLDVSAAYGCGCNTLPGRRVSIGSRDFAACQSYCEPQYKASVGIYTHESISPRNLYRTCAYAT